MNNRNMKNKIIKTLNKANKIKKDKIKTLLISDYVKRIKIKYIIWHFLIKLLIYIEYCPVV